MNYNKYLATIIQTSAKSLYEFYVTVVLSIMCLLEGISRKKLDSFLINDVGYNWE